MRGVTLAVLVAAVQAGGCASLSVGASRYLASGSPDLNALVVANETDLLGPFAYETHGVLRHGGSDRDGVLFGLGADLTALSGRAGIPYLIAGLDLGIGTRDHPDTWSSWSAGLGMELMALGPLGVRAEGRYRRMTAEDREGLELGIRIGRAWARGPAREPSTAVGRPAVPAPAPLTAVAAGGGGAGATRAGVVNLALEAMGTPYRWGGGDANGFDCSGLIQYAYAEHGIVLPRRSADQARSGAELPRDPAALVPGDILTFATTSDGSVTHVGLYLGERRFIHSATGGVQVSRLDPDDPYGRWWWDRWVGARRVIE